MRLAIPPKVFQRILLGSKLVTLPLVLLSLLFSYSLLLPFLVVVLVIGLFFLPRPNSRAVPTKRTRRTAVVAAAVVCCGTRYREYAPYARRDARLRNSGDSTPTRDIVCCGAVVVVVIIGASSHVHGFHRTPPGWKRQWIVVCCGESRSFGLLLLLMGHHRHRRPSSTRIVHEDRAGNVHRLLLLMIERVRSVGRPGSAKSTIIAAAAAAVAAKPCRLSQCADT